VLFLLVSLLFFLLGAEFLAVLLLVIYAGAIILLFLFVVFLLNLRTVELYNTFKIYMPIGCFITLLLWIVLCLLGQELWSPSPGNLKELEAPWVAVFSFDFNLNLFGHLLYEHFGYFTILVAVLLLTVMAAVILVTLALDNKQGPGLRSLPKGALATSLRLGKHLSLSAWSTSKPTQKNLF